MTHISHINRGLAIEANISRSIGDTIVQTLCDLHSNLACLSLPFHTIIQYQAREGNLKL